MSGIVLVPPESPITVVALSAETVAIANQLADRSVAFKITDDATFQSSNDLYKELQEFSKALEANRVEVKAPYLRVCTEIDASAKKIDEILVGAKRTLGAAVKYYQEAENARRAEQKRQAQAEAARLEREAYAAAEAKRLAEIAASADLPPDERPAMPDFAPPLAVAPVVVTPTPAPLKSSVRMKTDYTLIVDDISLIPRQMNGVPLLIVDAKAVLNLLKMGAVIPGCRLQESQSTAATGR